MADIKASFSAGILVPMTSHALNVFCDIQEQCIQNYSTAGESAIVDGFVGILGMMMNGWSDEMWIAHAKELREAFETLNGAGSLARHMALFMQRKAAKLLNTASAAYQWFLEGERVGEDDITTFTKLGLRNAASTLISNPLLMFQSGDPHENAVSIEAIRRNIRDSLETALESIYLDKQRKALAAAPLQVPQAPQLSGNKRPLEQLLSDEPKALEETAEEEKIEQANLPIPPEAVATDTVVETVAPLTPIPAPTLPQEEPQPLAIAAAEPRFTHIRLPTASIYSTMSRRTNRSVFTQPAQRQLKVNYTAVAAKAADDAQKPTGDTSADTVAAS